MSGHCPAGMAWSGDHCVPDIVINNPGSSHDGSTDGSNYGSNQWDGAQNVSSNGSPHSFFMQERRDGESCRLACFGCKPQFATEAEIRAGKPPIGIYFCTKDITTAMLMSQYNTLAKDVFSSAADQKGAGPLMTAAHLKQMKGLEQQILQRCEQEAKIMQQNTQDAVEIVERAVQSWGTEDSSDDDCCIS